MGTGKRTCRVRNCTIATLEKRPSLGFERQCWAYRGKNPWRESGEIDWKTTYATHPKSESILPFFFAGASNADWGEDVRLAKQKHTPRTHANLLLRFYSTHLLSKTPLSIPEEKLHQCNFKGYRAGLNLHKLDKFWELPPARNNPQRRKTSGGSSPNQMVNIFRIPVGGRKHPTHNIYQDEMRSVGLWWQTEVQKNTDSIHSWRSCFIRESVSPGVVASFKTNRKQMRMNCNYYVFQHSPTLPTHLICSPTYLPPLWSLHPSHLGSHGCMPTKPNGKGHEGKRDAQAIPKPRL